MLLHRATQSVLIVSSSKKPVEYISEILPKQEFFPVYTAANAGEAKRKLVEGGIDIAVINTPLSDEFGTELAVDIASDNTIGVLILVKSDVYENISYKMEQYGVLTLSKTLDRLTMYQSIKLLCAVGNKMKKLEESTVTLEKKLKEAKMVNRAKGLLIECLKMSEEEAHRYIEREAMDNCVKKADIAGMIIEKFEL